MQTYKYLEVVLDHKLEWSANTEAVYRKGQSRLFFLRRRRSFNVCSDMLCVLYHTVTESALFFAVFCWGSRTTDNNCRCPDKLVKTVSSEKGRELDRLRTVVEQYFLFYSTSLCIWQMLFYIITTIQLDYKPSGQRFRCVMLVSSHSASSCFGPNLHFKTRLCEAHSRASKGIFSPM